MSDMGVPLATVQVDDKTCTYCLECTSVCPSGALTYDKCFEHDSTLCMNCEVCMDICEENAITIMEVY